MSSYREVNFDGIVGPTHNYAGLAYGNTASMKHELQTSNPREAALQGLAKMYMLMQMGIPQAVLPPQERPYIPLLHQAGFTGSDANVLSQAQFRDPHLLSASCSAASMWTANAATIAPSVDTDDHRLHITSANLCSQLHRSIEHNTTNRVLKKIFSNEEFFVHHTPLPSGHYFGDEGAANHTRLTASHSNKGIHLFVYGRSALKPSQQHLFPARQTLEASQAIHRLHRLDSQQVIFAQQLPEAIDAGVFHNDVISIGNENFFLYHEQAFVNCQAVIEELRKAMQKTCHTDLITYKVANQDLTLEEAVKTYLFNSQIVTLKEGHMALIAPQEAKESSLAQQVIANLMASDTPVKDVYYVNLRESMKNGGGPACVRLRVVMSAKEIQAMHPGVMLSETLYKSLVAWVTHHYRDRLHPNDLVDSQLLEESRTALNDLTQILALGSIYDFQRGENG
ncbi:MAG: N-succinylarginine dihydrolase [Nitrosomonas sp.]|nr:MAG: N-succinylarginine dihydrolase [Nitrosomonas sp.]